MPATMLMIEYTPSEAQRTLPADQWTQIARTISGLPGLHWKYWLEQVEDGTRGGVYLFDTHDHAQQAGPQLETSLAEGGASAITLKFYRVDKELSEVTRGALPDAASSAHKPPSASPVTR